MLRQPTESDFAMMQDVLGPKYTDAIAKSARLLASVSHSTDYVQARKESSKEFQAVLRTEVNKELNALIRVWGAARGKQLDALIRVSDAIGLASAREAYIKHLYPNLHRQQEAVHAGAKERAAIHIRADSEHYGNMLRAVQHYGAFEWRKNPQNTREWHNLERLVYDKTIGELRSSPVTMALSEIDREHIAKQVAKTAAMEAYMVKAMPGVFNAVGERMYPGINF